jgi:ParB family transcriptional regulator, chromosome partitioning protein
MATKTVPIVAIRVGKRHRKDLGDIRSLAQSIQEIGLLHPVVIRPDGVLIAGERRLRALKLLGWQKVPVTVLDLDKVIRGEVAENIFRQDFRPSEMVAIAKALEPHLRKEAKARQGAERRKAGSGRARPQRVCHRRLPYAVKFRTPSKRTRVARQSSSL